MKSKYLLNGFLGKNGFWRYLLMIIAVIAATQLAGIPYGIVAGAKALANGVEMTTENLSNFQLLGIDPNLGLFLMLLSFVAGFFAIFFLVKPMHERSIKTTLTARERFDWSRFFFAVLIWGGIMILSFIVSYILEPEAVHFQFNTQQFIMLVIVAVSCLSLQSAFEEILFRGYLQQGLANLTKTAWVPLLLTSIIFGTLHIMNPEVKEYGVAIMLPQYIILGLTLAILTIMDDGLELAIGVHVVNNVLSALLVTHDSSVLQTPALFKIDKVDPVASLYEIIIVSIIFIAIMSYKYKWGSFKRLFSKVKPEIVFKGERNSWLILAKNVLLA